MDQKKAAIEITVGLFVLAGLCAMAWLSIKLGRMELVSGDHLPISAHFSSIAGLKHGASVEIAGVEVGRVEGISLDRDSYEAKVSMKIHQAVPIQEDAIASIRTKGLIGDRYVLITPGGSEILLEPEGVITMTEPAMQIEELVSQFVHGKIDESSDGEME